VDRRDHDNTRVGVSTRQPARAVDSSAYDSYIGRWSRRFVPAVVAAAEVTPDYRVLDISTGTGEAAQAMIPLVGAPGRVIGVDISPAMLESARDRLREPLFWLIAADEQALPFANGSFDAVVCQLRLAVLPPARCWINGVSTSSAARWLRGGLCDLDARPSADVGFHGTDGSNPASSSAESVANLTSGAHPVVPAFLASTTRTSTLIGWRRLVCPMPAATGRKEKRRL